MLLFFLLCLYSLYRVFLKIHNGEWVTHYTKTVRGHTFLKLKDRIYWRFSEIHSHHGNCAFTHVGLLLYQQIQLGLNVVIYEEFSEISWNPCVFWMSATLTSDAAKFRCFLFSISANWITNPIFAICNGRIIFTDVIHNMNISAYFVLMMLLK